MNPFSLLDPRLQKALTKLKITEPSEAQKYVIPRLLKKEQVLLVAPTGIGKTEAANIV